MPNSSTAAHPMRNTAIVNMYAPKLSPTPWTLSFAYPLTASTASSMTFCKPLGLSLKRGTHSTLKRTARRIIIATTIQALTTEVLIEKPNTSALGANISTLSFSGCTPNSEVISLVRKNHNAAMLTTLSVVLPNLSFLVFEA